MKKFIYKLLFYALVGGIPIYLPLLIYLIGIKPYISGDLDALAMIPFPKGYVKQKLDFKKKVIDCTYDEIFRDSCILVIGDSFSYSENGKLTTYVNYLAENSDLPVYNLVSNWGENSVYRFLYLAQKGNLPSIVIIESVERSFNKRIVTANLNFNNTQLDSVINSWNNERRQQSKYIELSQDLIRKRIFNYASGVISLNISKPLFSIDGDKSTQLYFFDGDLDFMEDTTKLPDIVHNLKQIQTIAAKQDCRLFFLIAVDKYDAYYPYIENNPFPKNNSLDSLCNKTPGINIINSKDTLSVMINDEVKDVYWSNNTHWSPVGSKAVGEYVSHKILHNRQNW